LFFYRKPRSDKCDTCEQATQDLKAIGDDSSIRAQKIIKELDAHKAEAERRTTRMTQHLNPKDPNYVQEEDWCILATDLMQTQPLPKLSNQSSFFRKKVSIIEILSNYKQSIYQ